ncbi:MAG: Gfo/Idh/MocA family oxidoreductase [Oscillospiraceae bacterium]|nr:Gfo/Idh/MocA family oxidoreductase [Oscillospiraceae bacterium]
MAHTPKAAIIGLGSRGRHVYAEYAKLNPDKLKITAVADTDPVRVSEAAKTFGIPAANCFDCADKLLAAEKLADILFICTPDGEHYRPAMLALEKGYHLLLEKPISPNPEECLDIARLAKERTRHVVVCHVLRYTPFYTKIKEIIDSGRIGDIVTIQAIENVGYYHHAHSFVRGNWRNSAETSPMILAKCCHDMDILLWLSGRHIKNVQSYGSLSYFKPEKAPDGAAARCLDGCKVKESCPYDAEKIYITSPRTGVIAGHTGWPNSIVASPATEQSLRRALETGPYGRCVFHCDNDVADHQIVNLDMDGGVTASLTMSAFTGEINRHIKVMGTLGEIDADMNAGIVKTHIFGFEPELFNVIESNEGLSGHGDGDSRMMNSLCDLLNGGGAALTPIDDSIESHLACFAAEYSRTHGGVSVCVNEASNLYQSGRKSDD